MSSSLEAPATTTGQVESPDRQDDDDDKKDSTTNNSNTVSPEDKDNNETSPSDTVVPPSTTTTTTTTPVVVIESLEIEAADVSLDEYDDTEALLMGNVDNKSNSKLTPTESSSSASASSPRSRCGWCCECLAILFMLVLGKLQTQRIGNVTVFWPGEFRRTGWGVMGPHWFGPPCVLGLLWGISAYFIRHAWLRIGPLSALVCTAWTGLATLHLLDASFRDPGIVLPPPPSEQEEDTVSFTTNQSSASPTSRPPAPSRQHRWCELCGVYQPPTGVHCPDCHVCVEGFDHHCVWMGCCIGKHNYKPFMRFNITWLLYLGYAVVWVTLLGPVIFRHHHHHSITHNTTLYDDKDIFQNDQDSVFDLTNNTNSSLDQP